MGKSKIPASVTTAIKKCWPNGVIEEFDDEESYFHSIRQALERDLGSIPGAALHWQAEGGQPVSEIDYDSDDDWEHEPLSSHEDWSSYHLFFISPKGDEFHFEDETEVMDYDEETGEEVSPGEMCSGEGWIGCAVGICLAARVAAVSPASYSQFEDGSQHSPDIVSCIYSVETNEPMDTVKYYRERMGEQAFGKLEQLRDNIAAILKRRRIQVLDPAILEMPVPNLTASEEVFMQPPLCVRDAFFFRGV